MKKKMAGIGVALAVAMSLGTAGMAFGATDSLTEGTVDGVATTVKTVIPTSYTVTIPEVFEVGTESAIAISKCIIPFGQTLTISTVDTLVVGEKDTTERKVAAITETVTAAEGIAITDTPITRSIAFNWVADTNLPKYADTYTGQVTFKAAIA